MKVRRRGGLIRLRFDGVESVLLYTLFDDLVEILRDGAGEVDHDPVQMRLFPAGYRDDEAAEDGVPGADGSVPAHRTHRPGPPMPGRNGR